MVKGFEEELSNTAAMCVVIEDTTGVVGYSVSILTGEDADLVKITVAEKERCKGYGRKLLDETVAELHNRGIQNVTLEVRASNEPAITLYERAGFMSEGVRPNFYEKPVEDAVIYWLRDMK